MKLSEKRDNIDFIGIKDVCPDEIDKKHPVDEILAKAVSSSLPDNHSDRYRHSYHTDEPRYGKHSDS